MSSYYFFTLFLSSVSISVKSNFGHLLICLMTVFSNIYIYAHAMLMKLLDDEALSNVTRFVKFYIIQAHSPLKWFLMIGLTFASMKSAMIIFQLLNFWVFKYVNFVQASLLLRVPSGLLSFMVVSQTKLLLRDMRPPWHSRLSLLGEWDRDISVLWLGNNTKKLNNQSYTSVSWLPIRQICVMTWKQQLATTK